MYMQIFESIAGMKVNDQIRKDFKEKLALIPTILEKAEKILYSIEVDALNDSVLSNVVRNKAAIVSAMVGYAQFVMNINARWQMQESIEEVRKMVAPREVPEDEPPLQ